ncbi:MAG: SHIRT domain-containing protein, partial [Erysipelotrichaceae bacterium]|nr:SHIRT domain-containing protein [Erysipelotrichaceae bacterium]
MNLSKRITAGLIAASMGLGFVPQVVYATDTAADSVQDTLLRYKVSQEINEGKTQSTISLMFTQTENVKVEKVTLPDGMEQTSDLSTIPYVVLENGQYEFKVDYFADGALQNVTIPVQVTELNSTQNDAIQENSLLRYEVSQQTNEEKTETTISLNIEQPENVQLQKVIFPNGTEQTENFSSISYIANKNGECDFNVAYLLEGIEQNETIHVEVTDLKEIPTAVTNDELNATIELKGATYFDGTPWMGTHQYMVSDRTIEVPYNGWHLMQLTVEIPFQEGLEVKTITPSAASQYPDLSKIEKDDKNSKWTYPFFFYDNGKYDFTINYSLGGEDKTTVASFTVDGLVSIKDIAMRRHLINEYGEFSEIYYNSGQYVTKEILAMTPSVGFFTFGLDGDNGRTAENTTSLDGLQYLTNATGLYLFDCKKLAPGETIAPVTQGYYPKMTRLRVSELNQRPQMPASAYNGELVTQCIANMPALTELVINGTGFSDCTVFRKITNGNLYYLQAMANNIVSLEGIESQPNLSSVNIGQNQIQSIEPLSKLNEIDFVNLMRNQVFDLRPLNENLNKQAVAGSKFAAKEQNITYDRTVVIPLKNGEYKAELPMPIDIDGTLTDTTSVKVQFADGTSKSYSTTKSDGKTYISILQSDVDSSQENPFDGAVFTFDFNNNNGIDTRTKGWFTGTVSFKANPIAKNYHVIYDFISGTSGETLPEEVIDLLPIDPTEYEEGTTITAIQPTSTTVTVDGGVWTFEGYDADIKLAIDANANENGDIPFAGTWTFQKSTGPDKPVDPDKPIDPDKPVDPD